MEMTTFSVPWRARWWSDDGVRHDEHGVEVAEAPSAWHVRDELRSRTIARVGWPRRPFRLVVDDEPMESMLYWADYPADLPDRHVLRERVFAGTSPAALFAALLDRGATRLGILIAFHAAFDVSPEEAIEDLGAIDRQRHVWSRAVRIREAFQNGRSVVDTLHVLYRDDSRGNTIALGKALRDALELEFRDIKLLVEMACLRDPAFERELAGAIERSRR